MKDGVLQPLKIVKLAQTPLYCAILTCIFFVEVTFSLC